MPHRAGRNPTRQFEDGAKGRDTAFGDSLGPWIDLPAAAWAEESGNRAKTMVDGGITACVGVQARLAACDELTR